MPSGNFTKQWIFLKCGICNKEIKFSLGEYNSRLKRGVKNFFCSPKCRNIGHRQEDKRDIKLLCNYCGKDFTNNLDKYVYNRRIKDIEIGKKVFCCVNCSTTFFNKSDERRQRITETQKFISCPQRGREGHEVSKETRDKIREKHQNDNSSILKLKCNRCGKEFARKRWIHNDLMKKSTTGNIFCSNICASTGRIMNEETKNKIRLSQLGISKPKSGVLGHEVSKETRLKISQSRSGVPTQVDWNIVLKELEYKKIKKYSLTRAPIPDAIWIDEKEGKLIALELEKKPWFAAVKKKMDMYKNLDLTHHNAYDKVYLVWYTLDGIRRNEWLFENGKWNKLN